MLDLTYFQDNQKNNQKKKKSKLALWELSKCRKQLVVNVIFHSGDYKDEKGLMILTFNSLGVSGGRETIEEMAGGGAGQEQWNRRG